MGGPVVRSEIVDQDAMLRQAYGRALMNEP